MKNMPFVRRASAALVGTIALVVAGAGSASAAVPVTLVLPAGVNSVYVYQGRGPEGDSNFNECYWVGNSSGGESYIVGGLPASRGQSQWHFYAYADSGCPITSEAPIGVAKNQSVPRSGRWVVRLR